MNPFSKALWLRYELGQNTIGDYLLVLMGVAGIFLFRRYFSVWISRLLYKIIRKRPGLTALKTFESLLTKPLEWLLTLLVVYFCLVQLQLPGTWQLSPKEEPGLLMVLSKVYRLSLIGTFTFLIIRLIDFFAIEFLERQDFSRDGMLDRQLLPFVRELLKIFVVIVAFFFGLGFVFELNVANIIAGLGLGGLAVALAAKESMENLFASFTIFLDKPFVVGDQVTVDGITGSIEKVGFRSTRIRTLDQSLVSLPNKILIDHALENQTLRTHRKIDFLLTIEYSHSMQELEGLLSELRSLVAEHPRFSDDSLVRLFELGENGFQIRILLIAEAPEFSDFLGLKEEFHLKILQLLETNAIRLAFPTRKVHLVSPSGPPTNQAL